ncbi:protein translocase subunit SecF [Candidatus Peregrinibacteria bacterium]|nr:protein translocase subunit SecF [Candidatus Peregrinibacteria bacterium]
MSFANTSKIFAPLSGLLVLVSLVLLIIPGPRLSIEFTGGTLIELSVPEGTKDNILLAMRTFAGFSPLETISITQTKEGSFFVRMHDLTNEEHLALMAHMEQSLGHPITELQFTTIGPSVGSTLTNKSLLALIIATIVIILYIALAFRKIPRYLSPWRFGLAAVLALAHDILITVGIFVLLSRFTTFQMDTLFVTALLSIMGYSVNDTIIIFDRIRDNLFLAERRDSFADIVEYSLRQSVARTLNTGMGALIMLFALFFLASESIHWFVLTLIVGTVIGTYSSFFVATPLLSLWQEKRT